MPAPDSVLITRPAGQEGPLRHALEAAGFRVSHQPLLELERVPGPDRHQQRLILDLDRFQHVIFVSANAVRFGLDWLASCWPRLPLGPQWYAVGEATADLLREQGLAPLTPGRQMSTEGLLALPSLQVIRGERVMIVKGEGGRRELAGQLAARGAQVESLCCYRRLAPALPAGALAAQLRAADTGVVTISSGEGLDNFLALLSPEETTKLQGITLLVPSERIALQARQAGWRRLLLADNASDDAVLQALRQWRDTQGDNA